MMASHTFEIEHKVALILFLFSYIQLISSVDNRKLKLSKHDDEIYEQFRKDFPDFDVKLLVEDELKSDAAKTVSYIF